MNALRLHSTSLVLIAWAALWWLGLHSDKLVGACLALVAVTVVISERERRDRGRTS